MPDFLRLEFIDVLDILLVGLLIYQVYKMIRGTGAVNIFIGILLVIFLWLVVRALHMELLTSILDKIISVGVLAMVVVFQPEIRRFLLRLGSGQNQSLRILDRLRKFFHQNKENLSKQMLEEITHACSRMADRKTGALIAIERSTSLDYIAETGDSIDASPNRRLIENIFFKNSPLHDGGMILSRGRIEAARCTFPMSENQNIPAHYGMRHRAAVGLSEQTDAFVIVVSEETGVISTMDNGIIKTMTGVSELRLAIENAFK